MTQRMFHYASFKRNMLMVQMRQTMNLGATHVSARTSLGVALSAPVPSSTVHDSMQCALICTMHLHIVKYLNRADHTVVLACTCFIVDTVCTLKCECYDIAVGFT